jgi:hypothetical protein
MTAMSVAHEIKHENIFPTDRLYKSYVGLGLRPPSESGSRTILVAHFGTFEVRFIEFSDCDRRGSSDLWVELYRHDTQSSLDSCLCRDFDEVENLGEYLIAQARKLYETEGQLCR